MGVQQSPSKIHPEMLVVDFNVMSFIFLQSAEKMFKTISRVNPIWSTDSDSDNTCGYKVTQARAPAARKMS